MHIDQGTLHTNGHLKIPDGVFLTGSVNAAIDGDLTAEVTVNGEEDTWKMPAAPLTAPFTGPSETGLFSSVWTQSEEGGSVPASANPNIYTFTENADSDDLMEFWTAEQNLNTTLEPGTGVLARLFGKDDFHEETVTWPKHLEVTGPLQSDYFNQVDIPVTFTQMKWTKKRSAAGTLLEIRFCQPSTGSSQPQKTATWRPP